MNDNQPPSKFVKNCAFGFACNPVLWPYNWVPRVACPPFTGWSPYAWGNKVNQQKLPLDKVIPGPDSWALNKVV